MPGHFKVQPKHTTRQGRLRKGAAPMTEVQTVTGTIDSSELGRTLVHEHIFVLSEEMRQNYDTTWDDEERISDAVTKLNDLKAAGIDTIFDPTVVGLTLHPPSAEGGRADRSQHHRGHRPLHFHRSPPPVRTSRPRPPHRR